MANATFHAPIKHVQGTLDPNSHYYHRVLNGKDIIQRRPSKPPSAAQQIARERFIQRYRKSKPSAVSAPTTLEAPSKHLRSTSTLKR